MPEITFILDITRQTYETCPEMCPPNRGQPRWLYSRGSIVKSIIRTSPLESPGSAQ